MIRPILNPALLSLALTGCATLGTNIAGDFSCRPPKGDCAPTATIDARASAELGADPDQKQPQSAQRRAGVRGGVSDAGRTAERTIRIVFPAHVDAAGTLHDEAVAWAVIAPPEWRGALQGTERGDAPLIRSLREQLKAAQAIAAVDAGDEPTRGPIDLLPEAAATSDVPTPHPLFPLASPYPVPSPADEASAGEPPPAAGGSAPPPQRTPRPLSFSPLAYPSAAAMDAAKRARPAPAGPVANPTARVDAKPAQMEPRR